MKLFAAFCLFVLGVALVFQYAMADAEFHDLQFIKITAPKKNQKIKAGEDVKIEYSMQPLVYSKGYFFSTPSPYN